MKPSTILLVSAIVIEVAAIILLSKAVATDSEPALGLVLLVIGVITMIIGISAKKKPAGPR